MKNPTILYKNSHENESAIKNSNKTKYPLPLNR